MRYFLPLFVSLLLLLSVALPVSALALEPPEASEPVYMAPEEFFAVYSEDEYTIMPMAVQSQANTPISSSSGLKGILLSMFGPYDPPITQLRYQANSTNSYTYVNDIQPDYPWLASAVIFVVVLYCIFKMGGALLCRK